MHRTDPVFLLSPGRSGSTLLQRYLNCSDELIIWGEHGGIIRGLQSTYYNWSNHPHFQKYISQHSQHVEMLLRSDIPIGVDIEWTNNFTQDDLKHAFQALITSIFSKDVKPYMRWGFKEIRYGRYAIIFLREIFPAAQFIFIVRDPIDTLSSALAAWGSIGKFWEYDQETKKKNQELIQKELDTKAKHLDSIATSIQISLKQKEEMIVKYEDLAKNTLETIEGVCAYLNIAPIDTQKVENIRLDIRKAMKYTKEIKTAINDQYLNIKSIQNLIQTYKAFNY